MKLNAKLLQELKHEVYSLMYIVIVNTLFNFKFPMFVRVGYPLNIVVSLFMSLACIYLYCTFFLYPELYAPQYNLDFYNDSPDPALLKKIHTIIVLSTASAFMYYFWKINYYNMSNYYYALLFAHWFIVYQLIARIMKRYNRNVQKNNNDAL